MDKTIQYTKCGGSQMKDQEAIQKILAKNMRRIRLEEGVSQGEIAKILGVSRTTYVKWETEYRTTSLCAAYGFATFFKVSMDELLKE